MSGGCFGLLSRGVVMGSRGRSRTDLRCEMGVIPFERRV